MYQYVFFDLDGTLTDSKEGVLECVRYAIEGMGRPVPEGDLLKFIGPPLQDSFMRYCGLSQEESRRALELFRERYVPVGQFKNRPAPGMAEMMGRLKERGLTLALASSKAENQCVPICERFGFDSLGYQSLEGVLEAIGIDKDKLCTYCWSGKE